MGPMCRALVVCLTPARVSVSKLCMPFDEGVDRASRHVINSRQIERRGDGGRRLVKHAQRSSCAGDGDARGEGRRGGSVRILSPGRRAAAGCPAWGRIEPRASEKLRRATRRQVHRPPARVPSAWALESNRWVDGWAWEIASVHEVYSGARQRLTAAPLAVYDTLGMVPLPAIARRPRAARPTRPSCRAPRQRIAGAGAPTTALIRRSRRSQRRAAR